MLSKDLVTEKKEKMEFQPIPEDVYQVELFDITDRRVPQYKDKTQTETILDFQFVLLEGIRQDLSKLRGISIPRNFVPNYFYEGKNGKNVTMQIAEAITGRQLSDEEYAMWGTTAWENCIGKQLRIVTVNNTKDDKTYSNIKTFLPIKNEMEGLTKDERNKAEEYAEKQKERNEKKSEETDSVAEEINIDDVKL